MRVTAVVVTYNRKELLRECLTALGAQTRPVDRVLVIDNASTDGTPELVHGEFPGADLTTLAENGGGAGGFHAGMREAYEAGADWMWLMDDDTIPTPTALAELLAAPEALEGLERPLLLGSKVVWSDGRLHPMNLSGLARDPAHFIDGCARRLVPLRTATFVSLLVHREAVDEFGLPLAHYFIWSDDIEYTARITRARPKAGYLVPSSVAEHRTKTPHTAVSDTGGRFYFHVRNSLYMLRSRAWGVDEKLSLLFMVLTTTRAYLATNRFGRESLAVVGRGVRDGLSPVRA